MATGDAGDVAARLRALLPSNWFPFGSMPVLDSILAGPAAVLSGAYQFLGFVKAQMRLPTSSGVFLDFLSCDFFGYGLLRRAGEADSSFLSRISGALLAPVATRPAMEAALLRLTGRAPTIYEPFNPADTRGYGVACGYNAAGRYGCRALVAQCFIDALRPLDIGIPNLGGYRSPIGGYGIGAIKYLTASQRTGAVQDSDIIATINATKPAGVVCWVNISG
jgi:hypothetical protein